MLKEYERGNLLDRIAWIRIMLNYYPYLPKTNGLKYLKIIIQNKIYPFYHKIKDIMQKSIITNIYGDWWCGSEIVNKSKTR